MAEHLQRIQADMKSAMKQRDELTLRVTRMLIDSIKKQQIDQQKDDIGADAEIAILRKAVKTRRDSVEQAEKLSRPDIAGPERAEIAVVERYLPQALTGDALLAKVKELATEIGWQGQKDFGRFMKEWMTRHKSLAEGKDVQDALKRLG